MTETSDRMRAQRRRNRSQLLVLAIGLVVFCAAVGALYYVLQPAKLRIAVGPPGSDDAKFVQAMADVFADEGSSVRLSVVPAGGAVEALALLGAGEVELAVGRGDLDVPADAQSLALLRKNYAVLWSPSGKKERAKAARKITGIADLAGHRVGVIGNTPANPALLRMMLSASGVEPDKVAVTQFGPDRMGELASDVSLDAYLAVGPLDSQITADAIAATARARGAPSFLGLDASEAIALKHPRYEAEEIPPAVFNAKPAWPEEKVDTISVNHLILARKSLSAAKAAAFFRQLFALRQLIAQKAPGAAHISKPDTEKDAGITVHRGAADVINGTERTFLDKYGDYFWFALLLASGLGSATAWLRRYLNRDERNDNTTGRNRILAAASEARTAAGDQELLTLQREVDDIIRSTLACYDEGDIEEEELAAFGLVLELFDHAVADRRQAPQADPVESGGAVRGPSLRRRP